LLRSKVNIIQNKLILEQQRLLKDFIQTQYQYQYQYPLMTIIKNVHFFDFAMSYFMYKNMVQLD